LVLVGGETWQKNYILHKGQKGGQGKEKGGKDLK